MNCFRVWLWIVTKAKNIEGRKKTIEDGRKMEMHHISERYNSIFPMMKEDIWREILKHIEHVTEIRIRAGKPILIYMDQKEISIDAEGRLLYVPRKGKRFSYQEIQQLFDFWCQDSRYAFQNEIRNGFLTIEGGHRIGICGEVVSDEEGKVQTIKYISSLSIRVAHEKKGVAKEIMQYIHKEDQIKNTLIVSPPGAGKTTLLRDVVWYLSNGDEIHSGVNVGLVDERGEIAACFQGIPQLDVGVRTDVLDNCKKVVGMRMLLRSMSPRVIAVDELGDEEEIRLIQQMAGNGCMVIATIHGNSIEELRQKKMLRELWEKSLFENIVLLSKKNHIFHKEVYSNGGKDLYYSC